MVIVRFRMLLAFLLAATLSVAFLTVSRVPSAHADTGAQSGQFVPAQGRVLDTRSGVGGFSTPMPRMGVRQVQVAGVGGVPATDAIAVSITMTIVNPSSYGTVMAAPTAAGLTASSGYLGYEQGKPASATAIVQLSDTGSLSLEAVSEEDLIIDIQGYFKPAADGTTGGYTPVTPVRVADTRSGIGVSTAKVGNGQTAQIPVSSNVTVSANAVFANVTVISPAAAGSFKAGNTPISFEKATTAVGTTLPIVNGKLQITVVSGGPVDLAIDLEGYFTPSGTATTFTPSSPTVTYPDELVQEVPANSVKGFKVAGIGDIPSTELGTLATVASMRVFADDGSSGYIAAWNASDAEPHTSVANYNAAESSPANTVIFEPNADGYVKIANHGSSSVQVELFPQGYFSGAPPADETFSFVALADDPVPDTLMKADLARFDPAQDTFGGSFVPEHDLDPDDADPATAAELAAPQWDQDYAASIAGATTDVFTVDGATSVIGTNSVPSGYYRTGTVTDSKTTRVHFKSGQYAGQRWRCTRGVCHKIDEVKFQIRLTLEGGSSKYWHFGTTTPIPTLGHDYFQGSYNYTCAVNVKGHPDHTCVNHATSSGRSGDLNMTTDENADTWYKFEGRNSGINYAMIGVNIRFGNDAWSRMGKLRSWDVCNSTHSKFCQNSGNGK